MGTFNISAETLLRLASVCDYFEPETPDDLKLKITTVRLENRSGKFFAISTNRKIAAVEFIGETDQPDEATHIKLNKSFLSDLQKEANKKSILTLTTIPEIAVSMMQGSSGYVLNDCCHWFDHSPMDLWREWANDSEVTESTGIMQWDLYHVEKLIASSPSGKVYFPEFIDALKPCTIRDRYNPKWVGLFIPDVDEGETRITTSASLPEWWSE